MSIVLMVIGFIALMMEYNLLAAGIFLVAMAAMVSFNE